jgi:hypothetical protein
MARKRTPKGWDFKKYNEYFTHNNKRWEVIHKTTNLIYAVELSNKGIAQGPVEKFPI